MTRQLDSTGLKRLHRTWRRRTDGRVGAAPRQRAVAVQRRRDPAHRRRVHGRPPVARRRHRLADRRQDGQDRARVAALPRLVVARHRRRRRRRGPRRRLPRRGHRADRRRHARCPRPGSTAPCASSSATRTAASRPPPWPPATRWRSSRSSGGSARSTWPPPPPSPCTRPGAGPGSRRRPTDADRSRACSRAAEPADEIAGRPSRSPVPTLAAWPSPASARSPTTSWRAYINVVRTAFVEGPRQRRGGRGAAGPHRPRPGARRLRRATAACAASPGPSAPGSPCPAAQHRAVRGGHQRRRAAHPHPPWPPHPADAHRSSPTWPSAASPSRP